MTSLQDFSTKLEVEAPHDEVILHIIITWISGITAYLKLITLYKGQHHVTH
jgi:hypothetical protein